MTMRRTCPDNATHHEGCPCHEQAWRDTADRLRAALAETQRDRDAEREHRRSAQAQRDGMWAEVERLRRSLKAGAECLDMIGGFDGIVRMMREDLNDGA